MADITEKSFQLWMTWFLGTLCVQRALKSCYQHIKHIFGKKKKQKAGQGHSSQAGWLPLECTYFALFENMAAVQILGMSF